MSSLLQRTLRQVDDGDLDAIEETWMLRMESSPTSTDFFCTICNALVKSGSSDAALVLFEMLDEELRETGEWEARIELLRGAGKSLLSASEELDVLVGTLRMLYEDKPSFGDLLDKVGLGKAPEDRRKNWQKARRLESLLRFDVGSPVHLEGKGAGRVTEVNLSLDSFKIAFESGLELRVGFGGVAKLLKPLREDHILYTKLTDIESLQELAFENPPALLKRVLQSYDKPRTGADIKRNLEGVIPPKKWASWWANARKDPHVLSVGSGRVAYSWAKTTEDASSAIWEEFENSDPRKRLDMLRKSSRDTDLKEKMSAHLASFASEVVTRDAALACEIWLGLERSGVTFDGGMTYSPHRLLGDQQYDPRRLAAGVADRALRERFYRIAAEIRDDWSEVAADLLSTEIDSKLLDILLESLDDRAALAVLDRVVAAPYKAPAAFTWVSETAAQRPAWLERNPGRFAVQILNASSDRRFAPYRARLTKLGESGHTLARLIPHLDEQQARKVAVALERTTGFQDYQKEPLDNALQLRFPALRTDEEQPLYCTEEKLVAKEAELKNLVESEIPANRRAIETAREMGDLRENFEYKSARERHEYLTARAGSLDAELRRARLIDTEQVSGEEVVIGTRVTLTGTDGETRTFTILGPWESSPENGILSNESDLAQSMLGSKLDQTVELKDGGSFTITAIEPYL